MASLQTEPKPAKLKGAAAAKTVGRTTPKLTPPRIFVGTRTHKQIDQLVSVARILRPMQSS
jgi:hypothetical protein